MEYLYPHKHNTKDSLVLWLTGLSGSGKSSISQQLSERLSNEGLSTYIIDGDNVRTGLCSDLTFSVDDRKENIRRVTEVAKILSESGILTIVSLISPLIEDRERAKERLGENFVEVYCNCPLEVCEERDVKGIYAKARNGLIKDFTGISSPYEPPESPDIILNTAQQNVEESVELILSYLRGNLWKK